MQKDVILTNKAPEAIAPYSQAVAIAGGTTVYLSGQIPLVPKTMKIIEGNISEQICQVFKNLNAVCKAAGGDLNDIVKLNIFLTDLRNFPTVNKIMAQYFSQPYPARVAVGIKELPQAAHIEIDGILIKESPF